MANNASDQISDYFISNSKVGDIIQPSIVVQITILQRGVLAIWMNIFYLWNLSSILWSVYS